MKTQKTNREKLLNSLNNRLAQMANDKEAQELDNNAISFTKKEVYELMLPCGGPVDGFKIFVDPITQRVDEVIYYNEDYSLYEEVKLTDKQIAQNKLFFDYLANG